MQNYTLTLTKEIGKLWILEDIKPFHKNFNQFFNENLGHDIGKVMTSGCTNHVLDILAGEDRKMNVQVSLTDERAELPGCVEFELVKTGSLAARYLVNNCPGMPQLEAWVNDPARIIFKAYPRFAYIKKI